MGTLGNIVWFIFGGFVSWLMWILLGLLYCITLIGIPVGLQCFKLAKLSACPFGRSVQKTDGGASRGLLNFFWFIFGGLEMAISEYLIGIVCCITIIGIPFGLQHFKIAKLSLAPFGKSIVKNNIVVQSTTETTETLETPETTEAE